MSTQLDLAVRGTTSHSGAGRAEKFVSGSRAALLWIIAVAVILIAAIGAFFVSIVNEETDDLHPESVQPRGTKALMEMLRDHGVDVTVTESRSEALAAAAEPDTTVLLADTETPSFTGTPEELTAAVESSGNSLVLVDPLYTIDDYTPAVSVSSHFDSAFDTLLQPECAVPAAEAAGPVRGTNEYYTAQLAEGWSSAACYPGENSPSRDGAYVYAEADDWDVTVLGSSAWMTNAEIDEEGHAALMLHTLGKHENLVYYLPQSADQPGAGGEEPTDPVSLIPPWFGVALLWLIPVAAALLWWRVRRFGPLAVERLPVVVPPVETVHGRAALMQRAGARRESLHSLRTGSLLRIARLLARPAHERPEQLCDAIAAHTGRDPAEVRYAYLDAVPGNDRQLSELAVLITTIESEVSPT